MRKLARRRLERDTCTVSSCRGCVSGCGWACARVRQRCACSTHLLAHGVEPAGEGGGEGVTRPAGQHVGADADADAGLRERRGHRADDVVAAALEKVRDCAGVEGGGGNAVVVAAAGAEAAHQLDQGPRLGRDSREKQLGAEAQDHAQRFRRRLLLGGRQGLVQCGDKGLVAAVQQRRHGEHVLHICRLQLGFYGLCQRERDLGHGASRRGRGEGGRLGRAARREATAGAAHLGCVAPEVEGLKVREKLRHAVLGQLADAVGDVGALLDIGLQALRAGARTRRRGRRGGPPWPERVYAPASPPQRGPPRVRPPCARRGSPHEALQGRATARPAPRRRRPRLLLASPSGRASGARDSGRRGAPEGTSQCRLLCLS